MVLKVTNTTIDCADVATVAGFSSAALGRPLDDGASDVFASIDGADAERAQPAWYFNQVPEAKAAKSRVHLDPALVTELVALGARVVTVHDWGYHGWTVMEDPEGNEFCVAATAWTG